MNKITYTPGPWTAKPNNCYWEIIPINGGSLGIPFAVGECCASEPANRDGGLQEANARLMAAAPELLAQLEAITDRVAAVLRGVAESAELHGMLAASSKLIAKARGRS